MPPLPPPPLPALALPAAASSDGAGHAAARFESKSGPGPHGQADHHAGTAAAAASSAGGNANRRVLRQSSFAASGAAAAHGMPPPRPPKTAMPASSERGSMNIGSGSSAATGAVWPPSVASPRAQTRWAAAEASVDAALGTLDEDDDFDN
jgi:hypothetical protein